MLNSEETSKTNYFTISRDGLGVKNWSIIDAMSRLWGGIALLTAEDIWFKCDLYLQFIPPINIWNIWINLRPFLKCKEGPFLRSWRSPRSNNLEIQNDKNSK